ncbi:MAG: hypothetical protein FWC73_06460, partial [Defluviitaleaceae bacterium]|nr:hypothetical protein [Defluviitaleaceae bacterium]
RVTFHAEAGGYLSFGYEYVENGETLEYYQIPTPYAYDGYEFIGWAQNPYGYVVTDDVEFVAQFAPVETDYNY